MHQVHSKRVKDHCRVELQIQCFPSSKPSRSQLLTPTHSPKNVSFACLLLPLLNLAPSHTPIHTIIFTHFL